MNGSVHPSVRLSLCPSVRLYYPIWRRQKLPYMKKTRKKKQVCGAACFMAAEIKFSEDVRPSHLFDYVPIIISSWNLQELLPVTEVTSMQKVKFRGQRSRSQRSQPNRFRTVTPVWIHIWWWNDAYCLIMLRRGALLFFKVIRQISRSHGSKNRWIWPRLGVSGL